jgi:hypothetical protein
VWLSRDQGRSTRRRCSTLPVCTPIASASVASPAWLYLAAEATLYAAEVNVVRARRLWPRSILQPPLTRSDRQALADLAKQEERRPEESIHVDFTEPPATAEREPQDHSPP